MLFYCALLYVSYGDTTSVYVESPSTLKASEISRKVEVRNIFQCENVCRRDVTCKSSQYDYRTRMCAFLDFDLNPISGKRTGYFHDFFTGHSKRGGEATCSSPLCSQGNQCVHVPAGYLCMKIPVIDCGAPYDISMGNIAFNTTTSGSVGHVVCKTGYTFSGNNTVVSCTCDGQWEPVLGSCNVVDCGEPDVDIPQGNITFNTTTYKSIGHVVCMTGYNFSGANAFISCASDGKWETVLGSCDAIDCGIPETTGQEAIMVYKNTTYGSQVQLRCLNRTSFYGISATGTCSETGIWTGVDGLCKLDMVYLDDWVLVFRATADINQQTYPAWIDDAVYHDHPVNRENVQPGCMTLNTSLPCNIHFKSKLVSMWKTANFETVRLVILKNNEVKKELQFNGVGTDKLSWFSKSKLISSSWTDMTSSSTFNYFSLQGLKTRRFYINHSFNGCPGDIMWMVVIDGNDGSVTCPFDNPPKIPKFIYHRNPTKTVTGDLSDFERGDVMAIMVKMA